MRSRAVFGQHALGRFFRGNYPLVHSRARQGCVTDAQRPRALATLDRVLPATRWSDTMLDEASLVDDLTRQTGVFSLHVCQGIASYDELPCMTSWSTGNCSEGLVQ